MYFTWPTLRAHLARCLTFNGKPYTAVPEVMVAQDGLLLPMPKLPKPVPAGRVVKLVCPVQVASTKRMFQLEINPELYTLGVVSCQRHYDSGYTGYPEVLVRLDDGADLTKVTYLAKLYVVDVVVGH